MKDQFVPYNLALKLKELGFNEECFGYYVDGELDLEWRFIDAAQFGHRESVLAPLWQQAFDWFRKKHHLYIPIRKVVSDKDTSEETISWSISGSPWNSIPTYEEAREACLLKLIELCGKN